MFEIISENVHDLCGRDDRDLLEDSASKNIYEAAKEEQADQLRNKINSLIDDVITERLLLMRDIGIYQSGGFYKQMHRFISDAMRDAIRAYFK